MEPRAASVRRKLLCTAAGSFNELIAAWEPQDDEQRHLQWAQNISQALAPILKGGYISLLIRKNRSAFGLLCRTMSLLDLKQKYDPDDVSIDDRTSRTHSLTR